MMPLGLANEVLSSWVRVEMVGVCGDDGIEVRRQRWRRAGIRYE